MDPSSLKGSEDFSNELRLSVYFAKSFQTVYNIGESGVHLSYCFRFIHFEHFVLGDQKIDLRFLHP